MTTLTVHTVAELEDALHKATGGEVIALAPGDYGDLFLQNVQKAAPVTITSADPGQPASFNTVHMMECSNIALAGLELDFTPDDETVTWSTAIRVASSSNIDVTDCTITGGPSVRGIDPDEQAGTQGAEGILGLPIGVAVTVLWSEDVSLSGNTVSAFQKGLKFEDTHGITVSDNEIFDIRTTQLSGANCDDVLVENNYLHSSHPWNYGGVGDHGDNIHFWTVPEQNAPSANYVIRDNVLAQGDGAPIMGIYFDDNTNDIGYTNVLIENNVIHQGHIQGIRIEDVDGLRILDNTLVQSSGGPAQAPQIILREGSNNVLIDGNILSGTDATRAGTVQMGDNVLVQIHDPFGAGYVGDLFADGMSGAVDGLFALPGSMVDGYGSTVFATGVHVLSDRGEGLSLDTHAFSLGRADLSSSATVRWDFGDGTWGEGKTASHRYDEAGTHVVTAHIEEGGTVRTVSRTVVSLDPTPVTMSFDAPGGLAEAFTASSASVSLSGQASLEQSGHGQSVRLSASGAAIAVENAPEITTNSEFSITVGFRKDAGAEAGGGRVVYFSGTAVIDVGADGVSLIGRTDAGEAISLKAHKVGVQDSDWHQITYTFSQSDGTAILYLDGEEVARMDGLEGAQHVTGGHDLHLGNPYGANMKGLLDDFAFVRASLSPDEVSDAYARFAAGQPLNFAGPQTAAMPVPPSEPASDPVSGVEASIEPVLEPAFEPAPEPVVLRTSPELSNAAPFAPGVATEAAEAKKAHGINLLAGASDDDGDALSVQNLVIADASGSVLYDASGSSIYAVLLDNNWLVIRPSDFADELGAGDSTTLTLSYDISDGRGGLTKAVGTATIIGDGPAREAPSELKVDDLANAGIAFDLEGSQTSSLTVGKGAEIVDGTDGASIRLSGDGGMVHLGDLGRPEDDGTVTVDLTFDRDGMLDGSERLVWNHRTFGIELREDKVSVLASTADGSITRFHAEIEGIGDDNPHHLRVSIDSDLDRIQIVVDGQVVLDDSSRDLDLAAVSEVHDHHHWTLGTPWGDWFDGEITGLVIADDAVFVPPYGTDETLSDSQMLG